MNIAKYMKHAWALATTQATVAYIKTLGGDVNPDPAAGTPEASE